MRKGTGGLGPESWSIQSSGTDPASVLAGITRALVGLGLWKVDPRMQYLQLWQALRGSGRAIWRALEAKGLRAGGPLAIHLQG